LGRSVVLVDDRVMARGASQPDTRHVRATVRDDGAVVIDGQDLGPLVSNFFGPDVREFEWALTILVGDVPALRRALGISDDDDILDALVARFSGVTAYENLEPFLERAGIPVEKWTRTGD
jgi:hypothetical protein